MLVHMQPQLEGLYRKACFDEGPRNLLQHMKICAVTGDMDSSFSINGYLALRRDSEEAGGDHVSFRMVCSANHFVR